MYHKDRIQIQKLFSFHAIERTDMKTELLSTHPKKTIFEDSIPSKVSKLNADISAKVLQNLFDKMLVTSNARDNMKLANKIPVLKKEN